MMKNPLMMLAVAAALLLPLAAQAKIRLPSLIGPNMVVQPRSAVSVTPFGDKKAFVAQADAQGYWRLKVATPGAGGPCSLTFSDGEQLTIGNVLRGEVWGCASSARWSPAESVPVVVVVPAPSV